MDFEKNHLTHAGALSSKERLASINSTLYQLENLADFDLRTTAGRAGLRLALGLIFDQINAIEGEAEYETIGLIRGRIRDTYAQLYELDYTEGQKGTKEAGAFYGDISDLIDMIEERGSRFINDMEIYRRHTEPSNKQNAA